MVHDVLHRRAMDMSALSGFTFSQESFRFAETDSLSTEPLLEVFDGKRTGVVFRSVIPPDVCARVAANFRLHPKRYVRGVEAPGHYVGVFHYDKLLDQYLAAAEEIEPELDLLFEGTQNVWGEFTNWLSNQLEARGMKFRAAMHDGRKASRFLMRSWVRSGTFGLLPHEDEAQCYDPKQKGFEIQDAACNAIVSINMCVETSAGGNLRYWNIIPDEQSRNRLGLTYTGSPYPIEVLEGIEYQCIPVRQGDIYCFNGKAVHAVEALLNEGDSRSTMAFLSAKGPEDTIIYWT